MSLKETIKKLRLNLDAKSYDAKKMIQRMELECELKNKQLIQTIQELRKKIERK